MASNLGYTTATKVRDALSGKVNGYFTDAMIESCINRIEGVIAAKLKVSSSGNITGANTLSWTTGKPSHWIIEGAATYGAALQLCGPSAASWNTLDQLVNAQNTFTYMLKIFMDAIESEDLSDFITAE